MKHGLTRIRYIFPAMADFREARPSVCWEHMYGWMEGYGVLFDPRVLIALGRHIPEWENGWSGDSAAGDFIITSCKQATACAKTPYAPGIYVRPTVGVSIVQHDRVSEKDLIQTPLGDFTYPVGYVEPLRFDCYTEGLNEWRIADRPALAKMGNGAVAVAFEHFGILSQLINESPEKRLLHSANVLAAMLATTGVTDPVPPAAADAWELRLDFQAYGVMRLMLQWLLDKKGVARSATACADQKLLAALTAWQAGDLHATRDALALAFGELAKVRTSVSKLRMFFIEIPHMGILLEDRGWFELEWPQYAREALGQYLRWTDGGYRLSIEAGASCWKHLSARFPSVTASVGKLWDEGRIELTNGTFSLPYSLMSPLLLQYWQFAAGHAVYRDIFGRVPETYQAQENSLTPQMPELLKLFGYRYAMHMAQNHGAVPAEARGVIEWCSPAGHGITSLAADHPSLSSKGINYYLDLPLVHAELGDSDREMNYSNFMDLSFIPFRTQMVRAHAYAPVFGEYSTPSKRMSATADNASPAKRTYFADDYRFSASIFYLDHTNANAFSQAERVLAMTHRLRQAQLTAWLMGEEARHLDSLAAIAPGICLQEAHDVMLVQDQRQGEFFKFNDATPPYSRDTLAQAVGRRASAISAVLEDATTTIAGDAPTVLLNASEVCLSFARVQQSERFAGPLLEIGGEKYAVGPLPAWSAATPNTEARELCPTDTCPGTWGVWTIELADDGLTLKQQARKVHLAPADSRLGAFRLVTSQASATGLLLVVQTTWNLPSLPAQTVVMTLVLTEDGSMAEVNVSYSLAREFDPANRWTDHLTVDVFLDAPLKKVWRFNPNVRSETREANVVSPYYLAADTGVGNPLAILNEGASVYSVDRPGGKVHWFFHVAGERVYQRRMALAFGDADPFQLSRAWSQGVLPVAKPPVRHPQRWLPHGWHGLSVEGFTEDGELLVSNLSAEAVTVPIADDAPSFGVRNVAGTSAVSVSWPGGRQITLGPFELALLKQSIKTQTLLKPGSLATVQASDPTPTKRA